VVARDARDGSSTSDVAVEVAVMGLANLLSFDGRANGAMGSLSFSFPGSWSPTRLSRGTLSPGFTSQAVWPAAGLRGRLVAFGLGSAVAFSMLRRLRLVAERREDCLAMNSRDLISMRIAKFIVKNHRGAEHEEKKRKAKKIK
jgi:hypothetical protein